jgi:glycosyltransferase involved in cell wall biosynthesis
MRIGMIAPLAESLPPQKYGGTERVIYYLTEQLVKMGHDVTLFASGDSQTSAELVSVYPTALRKSKVKDIYGYNVYSILNMGLAYARQDEFDIIHDHNPHMGLPTANLAKIPVVMTWHGPFNNEMGYLFSNLKNPYLVSISKAQAEPVPYLNLLSNVYNGLPMEHYPFGDKPGDYMLYVGRIDMEKGLHIAIDAAVRLKMKLIVAAKVDLDVPHIKEYFDKYIKHRLEEHKDLVNWIGEVDEAQRNELMKNALCLIHPITWPEPFGLTIIEAMSCGCPVVANNLGSMSELVKHGQTGFLADSFEELITGIKNVHKIDRAMCRRHSLTNFSDKRMAEGYLQAYEKAIELNSLKFKRKINEPEPDKKHKLFPQFSFGNNSRA